MRLLFLLLCIFSTCAIKAQHPFFYKIDHEKGLPSDEVYQVVQDDFGFVWIGCDAGLYRYDGINFREYVHPGQNSRSISSLFIDRKKNLWCQNFTGQIFKVSNDSIHLFADESDEAKPFPEYTVDEFDRVWILNNRKIKLLDANGSLLREFTPDFFSIQGPPSFSDIVADGKGQVYITDFTGTVFCITTGKFSVSRQKLLFSNISKHRLYLDEGQVYLHAEVNPDREYILSRITPLENTILKRFKQEKNFVSQYFIKKAGSEIMVGTSGGVMRFGNLQNNTTSKKTLFPAYKVSGLMIDKEGSYWFTTLQNGILIVPGFEIEEYTQSNSLLQDENISAITLYGRQLYIGNYSGQLYQLDINKDSLFHLNIDKANNHRAVRKIVKTQNRFMAARGSFSDLLVPSKPYPWAQNIRDFIVHNDTLYFVSSDKMGFAVFSPKAVDTVVILKTTGGKKVTYDEVYGAAIYAGNSGMYQHKNGRLAEIKNKGEKIFATYLDYYKGKIFAGTVTSGVFVIKGTAIADQFDKSNGLTDNHVKCLGVYNGHLFACNKNGINKISLDKKRFNLINSLDGVSCLEINAMAFSETKIFLATIRGLIVLPLDFEKLNKVAPEIAITSLKVNDKQVPFTKNLRLTYYDRNIAIEFISTSFRSRGSFQYRYRLKNFNDNWQAIKNTSPEAKFLSIPEGGYEFEVVAVNEDGVVSNPASLHISVQPPFWKKWWFYIPALALLTLLAVLFFNFRLKKIRRSEHAKTRLIQSQLTALKAQMNPHFMFNALNSIQSLVLANDIKNANYYLSRYSTLTRKVLAASDNDNITVEEEMSILSLYLELEKLRFGNEFEYKIDAVDCVENNIPSMIIQPYVENAVKHGLLHKKGQKQLHILFEKKEDDIVCTITDNGIGIEKAMEIKSRSHLQQHKPYGTMVTLKRIELINSTQPQPITITSANLANDEQYPGTIITINIPV